MISYLNLMNKEDGLMKKGSYMIAKDILLKIIWKKEVKVKMTEAKLMMMKLLMSLNKCLLKKNKVLLEARTKPKRKNLNLTLQLLTHNLMNKLKLTLKN